AIFSQLSLLRHLAAIIICDPFPKTSVFRESHPKIHKGLFQPFSDMLKLTFKEIFYLRLNKIFYYRPIIISFYNYKYYSFSLTNIHTVNPLRQSVRKRHYLTTCAGQPIADHNDI
ncbi:hypothetical protein E2986_13011, partial [Frieseomelitta varia]